MAVLTWQVSIVQGHIYLIGCLMVTPFTGSSAQIFFVDKLVVPLSFSGLSFPSGKTYHPHNFPMHSAKTGPERYNDGSRPHSTRAENQSPQIPDPKASGLLPN